MSNLQKDIENYIEELFIDSSNWVHGRITIKNLLLCALLKILECDIEEICIREDCFHKIKIINELIFIVKTTYGRTFHISNILLTDHLPNIYGSDVGCFTEFCLETGLKEIVYFTLD